MKRPWHLAGVFLGPLAALLLIGTAVADTQYFAGGVYWGKTYRNNFLSSGCYDQYGSTSACYQGTWSETYYLFHYVSVVEHPQKWIPTIPGNYSGPFYWYQKADIQNAATTDVSVSSDYDAYFNHKVYVGSPSANEDVDSLSFVYNV